LEGESMYIDNPYEQFIHTSRYARWDESQGRRESWSETVSRYVNFIVADVKLRHDYTVPEEEVQEIHDAILNREVLPSMRAIMTAGPALARENVAGYNCAFLAIDDPRAFDEALYILMNGTGVGFSAESRYVNQLPIVPNLVDTNKTIIVEDSKLGWAVALQRIVAGLYAGETQEWDLSLVRPAGSPLKTFGGRASGPEPLNELLEFVTDVFRKAQGRKLTTLEAHEIMCKIGEVVVVGGVRRSALISLSDVEDDAIRDAKHGEFWNEKPHLTLSNNSAVYDAKPDYDTFTSEFSALIVSGSGERGIFSRYGAKAKVRSIGRDDSAIVGTNPCGEILLRSNQFCNLTTVVVDENDDLTSLQRKVTIATKLGTLQSTLTDFNHLRESWRKNTEEERLLGVSLNGPLGHPVLSGQQGFAVTALWLDSMRSIARKVNDELADAIGINRSAAITTVKPEGTTSQLTSVSSGMHPWHDKHYRRNVRGDVKDPLTQFLIDIGIPHEQDVTNPQNVVFGFPVAAPEGALTRHDLTAVEHLELWAVYSEFWTDHNPSITVNVRNEEWPEVAIWVWENFDRVTGISFLPFDDHVYKQAPYEPVSREEYDRMVEQMPEIDWSLLRYYETSDETKGSQELSCVAGACEVNFV
jgi:ribonucleoside-triphosphate reductase (thioredoxin)